MQEFTDIDRRGGGQVGSFIRDIEAVGSNLKVVGFAEKTPLDEICNKLGFVLAPELNRGNIANYEPSSIIGTNSEGQELIKVYVSAGLLVIRTPMK